jgi:hypothetical protein
MATNCGLEFVAAVGLWPISALLFTYRAEERIDGETPWEYSFACPWSLLKDIESRWRRNFGVIHPDSTVIRKFV